MSSIVFIPCNFSKNLTVDFLEILLLFGVVLHVKPLQTRAHAFPKDQ